MWPAFVAAFGTTYIFSLGNVAAPGIKSGLDASSGEIAVVLAGYAVAFSAGLVLAGRLGDRYGRRRMLCLGLSALALMSATAAAAPTLWVLVVVRVLQGVAAAAVMPQTLAIVQSSTDAVDRVRALAIFTASSGVGTVAGQVIGGAAMQLSMPVMGIAGWRTALLTSALPAVIAVAGAHRLPKQPSTTAEATDYGGALKMGIPLMSLIAGLSLGPTSAWSWWTLLLTAFGLVGLWMFWASQRERERNRQPSLLTPSIVRQPAVVLGLLMVLLMFAGYGAFSYEYSMLTQVGFELTPAQSGLVLTTFVVPFALAGLTVPRIVDRLGDRTMELAAIVLAAGTLALGVISWWTQGKPAELWIVCFGVIGVILGAAQAYQYGPLIGTVIASIPVRDAGLAGGLFATVQQAALAIGVATIGTFFVNLGPSVGWGHAFAVVLGVHSVTILAFWILARQLRHHQRSRS